MGWILSVANLPKVKKSFSVSRAKKRKTKLQGCLTNSEPPQKTSWASLYSWFSKDFCLFQSKGVERYIYPIPKQKIPRQAAAILAGWISVFPSCGLGSLPLFVDVFPNSWKSHKKWGRNHPNGNLPSLQIFAALENTMSRSNSCPNQHLSVVQWSLYDIKPNFMYYFYRKIPPKLPATFAAYLIPQKIPGV